MISKNILYLLTCGGALTLCAQTPAPTQTKPPARSTPAATSTAAPAAGAAKAPGASIESAIKAVLEKQTAAWNKGDTDGFLAGYAEDAVFISDVITKGLEKIRVRYQSHYPTRVSMGFLTFTDIEVHNLDGSHAFVIGHYHLQRAAEGGGDANGVFSLLFKRTAQGWKIAFDHTS